MVIMIISILGATALPQFLDFRNEAKVAMLQQNLMNIRTAYKNQLQQAMLKCGAELPPWMNGLNATMNVYGLLHQAGQRNDMTYNQSSSTRLCTTAQLPDPNDRKFFADMSDSAVARTYASGTLVASIVERLPINPFIVPGSISSTRPSQGVADATVTLAGGKCAYVTASLGSGIQRHWWYILDSGEWFAGSNTAGINECNF